MSEAALAVKEVTLRDKYVFEGDRIFLTGTQALVRLMLAQARYDKASGLHTGGFVSGYRGSPLGSFDRELWRAKDELDQANIKFWPGLNEDLAATAVWGTQQIELLHRPRGDGVFAMWYGKGAGLDRSTDAIRHAHAAGTTKHGGVLAVVGDDHALKSSTNPYHCEPTFADLLMPVLYPASVREMIDYGLLGFAMSRFSGAWIGLKTLAEYLDSTVSIAVSPDVPDIVVPEADTPPAGAVHARWPDPWPAAEERLLRFKIPAALSFARANRIDRIVNSSAAPRLGIITTGKSYSDLLQALSDLGISLQAAGEAGILIYKVGMPWPLEPEGIKDLAARVPELLIIEEKRDFIESQVKNILYSLPADRRPVITGKHDKAGQWQLPWIGELNPEIITRVLAQHIGREALPERGRYRLSVLEQQLTVQGPALDVRRTPFFCSGCPHNSSTRIPEGSRALGGVGCHGMVVAMDRNTATFTQMGGEGVPWIGQAPFCERDHVFANLGDGTFFHSGSLAIRASIAAKVNITYKLLFNDAVAMTGGQALDGDLSVPKLAQMLAAEGITRIAIVAEQPENHAGLPALIDGVTVDPRKQLDEVQRKLRDHKGVSALIFDQTCAAEKRRRRKRGSYPDAGRRVVINELVCEGCGDCQQASNCLSVVPKTTEFGRKRQIDQSTCNQDYSCVEGFCPSFVTIEGGRLRKPSALTASAEIPSPKISNSQSVCNIFVTGVGGTGVVTIGALLGMAAHLEGRGCTVMDMLGMAQKGGPVVSHIRLSPDASTPASVRVPIGGADLLLATDVLVAAHTDSLQRLRHGTTHAVVNLHEAVTGDGIRDVDAAVPVAKLGELLRGAVGDDCYDALEATALATALIGDAIATNVFLLGYSFQKGLIPLSDAALRKAIRLNGGPIKTNLEAFDWGRRAAADIEATRLTAGLLTIADPTSAAVMIQRRAAFLVGYQDTRYARQYEEFLQTVQSVESHLLNGGDELTKTVAQSLFKLMAYKDEYEVARLHTDNSFLQSIAERFEPGYTLKFHLAPPILSHTGPNGRPQKRVFGRWILPVFRLLARLKGLRGSAFDLFGYTRERRTERSLIFEYRATIERILASLTPENYDLAIEIAAVPEMMRGYGHVKAQNIDHARSKQANLLDRFERTPAAPFAVAAE